MLMILALAAGLVGTYIAILRPILMAKPQFKQFYADADSFWSKVWAVCYQSSTVVVTYAGVIVGALMNGLDAMASAVGDPGFQEQVKGFLGANPKLLGGVLMAFSAIVFMARMRSIIKG